MAQTAPKFRQLDSAKILETVKMLHARVEERFPGSGLGKVVRELQDVAEETATQARWIQRPHLLLRFVAGLLSLVIIALLIGLLTHIRQFQFDDFANAMQGLDAAISSVVFIGAAI